MRRIDGQKFLITYSGVLTLLVSAALFSGFTDAGTRNARFDTLTVQRINVVEPDGTLRMVLANNNRVPTVIINGQAYPDVTGRRGSTTAGIWFYDGHGTESGGLTFGGRFDENGQIDRFGHLSFDRHNQDQMFSIDARDDGTNFSTSIRMIDQPNWPIKELLDLLVRIQNLPPEQQEAEINAFFETHPRGAGTRTLLTSDNAPDDPAQNRNVLLFRDTSATDRVRLGIDANSVGSLEFLDQGGMVSYKIPPPQ
jgi:hypothetical protein